MPIVRNRHGMRFYLHGLRWDLAFGWLIMISDLDDGPEPESWQKTGLPLETFDAHFDLDDLDEQHPFHGVVRELQVEPEIRDIEPLQQMMALMQRLMQEAP